ncbi:aldo-keto reductase-like [Micractinium conductrix]|uniref:Aldo-keto reductase-like n=1 Tax=Micractinium conductrix TaxID=554055 RepID=A0A2P6VHP0_9CHLO|nr:aldo-keto reductase-like [Micractinium conductrix]|eukprot:PSC73609.1 aldo-keto reductase-like [Micractinium conductrix]
MSLCTARLTTGAALAPQPCAGTACKRQLVRAQATSAAKPAVAPPACTGGWAAAERVQLGASDLLVSRCCLGTMTWGEQNTEQEAHQQLSCAVDEYGLNFIDTAEIYPVPPREETQGATERYIGSWLAAGGAQREDIVLATKVSGYGRQTWLRKAGTLPRVDAANIEEAVDASLARLQTDYVDLLQIHWPDRYVPLFGAGGYDIANEREGDVPFEEQLRGMERVVMAGKVRHIGVSNETSFGVMRFIQAAEQAGLPRIVSIQNSYSLAVRGSFETDLAEVCAPRNCNVGLLAYSPLAAGSLSGKYIEGGAAAEKGRFNYFPGYMARYNKSLAKEAVQEYVAVACKHGITPVQLALAWCNSRWFVASSIIGATSITQLRENIEAFDVQLSEEALADVNAVFRPLQAACRDVLPSMATPGAAPLGHRGSDDFADALEAAMSTMHDDDMLLSGGTGELTIDNIHNLTTAPQHSGRIPSYTELGSAGLSLSSLPPPLQHLPQHTGPTHIGDIIPKARPTSSSASSQLSVEVPRRSGDPEDEVVSPLPHVASARKTTPTGKSGGASVGGSRPGSGGSAGLTSPSSGGKGKLPRVAMLSKPPPKKEEPLSPQKPTWGATRSPGARSAGPSPRPSPAGRANSATQVQRSSASAPGSRIPRPGTGGTARSLAVEDASGAALLRTAPAASPQRTAPAANGSPMKASSPAAKLATPQRSFGGNSSGRVPASPAAHVSGPLPASPAARLSGPPPASPAASRLSSTAPVSPGLRANGAASSTAGRDSLTARTLSGRASGTARPSAAAAAVAKMDTRQQLEDIMRDLQDIKKDLGLSTDAEAPAAAAPAAASGAAVAAAGPAGVTAEPAAPEPPAAEPAAAEPAPALEEPEEAAATEAAAGDAEPAAAPGVEPEAPAEDAAAAAAAAAQEAVEQAAAAAAAQEEARKAEAAAAEEQAEAAPEAAPAEEPPLPSSTAAACIEGPAGKAGELPAAALETAPQPADAAAAKQCCACSVM